MTSMLLDWCVQAPVNDKGNGPFEADPLGWVLHVNSSNGMLDDFFRAGPPLNPDSVCPNFQVYKDGTTHQHLPLNWQPWAQADGNSCYGAVETEGHVEEPLTDDQLISLAKIHIAYRRLGVPDQLADAVGERGIGTHRMGGLAWGNHPCPGPRRADQRADIISLAQHRAKTGRTQNMDVILNKKTGIGCVMVGDKAVLIHDSADVDAAKASNVPVINFSEGLFNAIITAAGGPHNG